MLSKLVTCALTALPPEPAHNVTIKLLASPFAPQALFKADPMLETSVAGLSLPNPLGMAAGFDKNAEVPDALLRLGFGFAEVGAVTPRPQPGNPSPRVFRLRDEAAVINRYGFNNDGLDIIRTRLEARRDRPGVVGINLGANKDSEDRGLDYVTGLQALEDCVDFLTVNVSSPNTEGLRALQAGAELKALLTRVMDARRTAKPVFVKVAPDLTENDIADITAAVLESGVNGMIVSNTTLDRDGVSGPYAHEKGGLSGAPLFEKSTRVLRAFAEETKGQVPLIGVGGVRSAADVLAKIKAGASAVQLYTALIYQGPGLVADIVRELPVLLRAEGFKAVDDAVGAEL
ncbi:MAG: quinone-dependent dihydroorotate dehydrogenase [Pseudomonadota bacterium]